MTLRLETFLPYRLAVAADAVSQGLAAVYAARFAITIPEWRLIANLGHHGALTAGEVAAHSSLDKVQVSRAVARLQRRRLVSRRVDTHDKRRAHLTLTVAGRRLFSDIAALALAWERDLLAGLPAAERAALDAALTRLTDEANRRREK